MYKYLRGAGQIWVDHIPPPKDATNVLWLKYPEEFGVGEEAREVRFEIDPSTGDLLMYMRYEDAPGDDWIQISDITTKGFELLVFAINAGTNMGEWIPLQGTRGKRGPAGVVVQGEEPEDPEIKIWVDTSEGNENVLIVEQDMIGDSNNPVSQSAVKIYVTESIEAAKEDLAQPGQGGEIIL